MHKKLETGLTILVSEAAGWLSGRRHCYLNDTSGALFPGVVKSATVVTVATFLRCQAQAAEMGPATRYTLWRNTAVFF